MTRAGSLPLSVLVLEDDPAGRALLREALARNDAGTIVREAHHLADFFVQIRERDFDLILVDLILPDGSGILAIRHAANLAPVPLIFAISSLQDQSSVVSAVRAGAQGFLCKHDDPNAIAHAISIGLSGGATVTPIIAHRLLQMLRGNAENRNGPSSLTPRESEVLVLASKGFKYSEIARMTQSSASTIYTHVRHIYEKLQVSCLSQALHEARCQGLI